MRRNTGRTEDVTGLQKNFKHTFRRYQIRNKATSAFNRYGAVAKHLQEADAQIIMVDALKYLTNWMIEDKKSKANLTSVNLTLIHSLPQAKEKHWNSPRSCRHSSPR